MRGAYLRALEWSTANGSDTPILHKSRVRDIAASPHHYSIGDIHSAMRQLQQTNETQTSLLRVCLLILMTQFSQQLYGEAWAVNLHERLPLAVRLIHNIAASLGEVPLDLRGREWCEYPQPTQN